MPVDPELSEGDAHAPGREEPRWQQDGIYYGWVLVLALGLTSIVSYGTRR
jgi:hypothetical protein